MNSISKAFEEISELPLDRVQEVGSLVSIPTFEQSIIISLCDQSIKILKNMETLVHLNGPHVIVGDIHGNLHDLLRVFIYGGNPKNTKYLFLGDYVDRGQYSIETIVYLLNMFVTYPENISLIKGNHEIAEVNKNYGFLKEVSHTYGEESVYNHVNEVFSYLPLAAVLDGNIFCVHGGLDPNLNTVQQIARISRPIVKDNLSPMVEGMLWSDPSPIGLMYNEGNRGVGYIFGFMAIQEFFDQSGMKMIIRAHEKQQNGLSTMNNTCITVFSSSGYHDKNQGAILLYKSPFEMLPVKYDPIDYPLRNDAAYYLVKIPHILRRTRALSFKESNAKIHKENRKSLPISFKNYQDVYHMNTRGTFKKDQPLPPLHKRVPIMTPTPKETS